MAQSSARQSFGLVRVIPGADLPLDNELPEELEELTQSQLTRHIQHHWEINRNAKLRIEEGLLEDLRARNGEYHPVKLQAIRNQGGSEIYMFITATKQRAAANWIKDIALPEDGKAWGIEPTPLPELPPWAVKLVSERVEAAGGGELEFLQLQEYLALEMNEQAKLSAQKMERKITDQLAESKFAGTMNELIDDFCTFSACILKGPFLKNRTTLKWKQNFGSMKPKITKELQPEFIRVSPFDIYPSPEANNVNDGHLIEHIRFERGELYNMIGVPGYKDEEIRNVLVEYKTGLRQWLWNDTERNENENHFHWWRDGKNGLIDGLHYWGPVQGSDLLEWGIEVEDTEAEYQIDAILIGRYIIRATLNNDPLARRPYHKACYDPIPGAFWGNSIRYLMNDIQEFCNATARALVNNMGMASGPMLEVNYERLSPLENALEIYPWKVWQTKGSEMGGGSALQFFQPDSNANELLTVYDRFEQKADDATSIPRYSHGNDKVSGAGSTASGLSMLMNSAAKGIKAAIGTFDFGITSPAIEMMYYYNMITTNDKSIQGDAKIVARGANALLLKDMAQSRRNEFLAITNNEIDMQIIGVEGRADILRATAKDFDLEGIVPTREVILERQKQAAENPPPDPEQIKAEAAMALEQVKQQGESQRLAIKSEADQATAELEANKMIMNKEIEMAKIEAKKQAQMDNQARDEAQKIRMMHEETARIIERNEINSETDLIKHERLLELKDKEIEAKASEPESTEAPVAKESKEPMVLNVVIDNTSGKVKKTIKINRDKDKMMSGIESVEEPA